MYYGSDETDEAGKYQLIVDKYVNGKEVKATGCWVRLVSSSDPTCNIPTDFAGGRSGVKLQRPTWIYRDQTKYTVDPFYYTTPLCDEMVSISASDFLFSYFIWYCNCQSSTCWNYNSKSLQI